MGHLVLANNFMEIKGEFTLRRDLGDWIGTRPQRPPQCAVFDVLHEQIGWADMSLTEQGLTLEIHLYEDATHAD